MSPSIAKLDAIRDYLCDLQNRIVAGINTQDPKPFKIDDWQRPAAERQLSGSGSTRVLEGGQLIERGGVNFSHVKGTALPASATHGKRQALAGQPFEAMGVSVVMHPRNPFVPTVHMNVRCFVAHTAEGPVAWFGGGMDLTPYYPFIEDIQHFHRTCLDALSPFEGELYPQFKAWCDRYFYLPHRQETRGAGGIFFDDFNALGGENSFEVIKAVGEAFLPAYLPIVKRRTELAYGEPERNFQAYRRGRYVEFNLVYDRGTLFGLQSGGRCESILMSMPPVAHWQYDWQAAEHSPEHQIIDIVTRPRDWLATDAAA